MNYYRRYIGDYQRDTMHLSLLEHGAYTMLLDSYYAQDGTLPETQQVLCRLCRAATDDERAAVEKVSQEFFPIAEPGRRHNPRADLELETAGARIAAARANGARGGRPPKPSGLSVGLAESNRKITQDATSPSSIPQPPEEETSTPIASRRQGARRLNGYHINYDWQTHKFTGIRDDELMAWQEAHPAISVPDQLERAGLWLKANPTKRKSNYERFILTWLGRAQDRGAPIK